MNNDKKTPAELIERGVACCECAITEQGALKAQAKKIIGALFAYGRGNKLGDAVEAAIPISSYWDRPEPKDAP